MTDWPTHITPELACTECGYKMDRSTGPKGVPSEGDFALCVKCGSLSIFTSEQLLRAPTVEEMLLAAKDERVQRFRRAILTMGNKPSTLRRDQQS